MAKKPPPPSPRDPRTGRWIRKYQVWNVKAKRYIRRKDGKPFVFWIP